MIVYFPPLICLFISLNFIGFWCKIVKVASSSSSTFHGDDRAEKCCCAKPLTTKNEKKRRNQNNNLNTNIRSNDPLQGILSFNCFHLVHSNMKCVRTLLFGSLRPTYCCCFSARSYLFMLLLLFSFHKKMT